MMNNIKLAADVEALHQSTPAKKARAAAQTLRLSSRVDQVVHVEVSGQKSMRTARNSSRRDKDGKNRIVLRL